MKKIIVISLGIIVFLINWRSSEPTENIIYYGTILTQEGNQYKVTHLGIGEGKRTKQIPFFELPHNVSEPKTPEKGNPALKEIILTKNPKTDLASTMIDLNEIQELNIPSADIVWVYQKDNIARKNEYIEVRITNRQKITPYLIDRNTDIYANKRLNGEQLAGTEEMKIPLPAIKKITLEGYYFTQQVAATPKPSEAIPPVPVTQKRVPAAP